MVTLTITTEDGRVATIAVAPSETIENVKALVEVELGILLMQQQLVYNGRTLGNEATVETAGIKDGDLLLVRVLSSPAPAPASAPAPAPAPAPAAPPAPTPAPSQPLTAGALDAALSFLPRVAPPPRMASDEPVPTGLTWEDLPAGILPDRLHAIVRANPPMMAQLVRSNPEMAEACQQEDPAALRAYMMRRAVTDHERRRQRAEHIQRLNDNPFDAEAQAKIAEAIRQENVQRNYQLAMEHVPEAFSRVHMLYVDCRVNGENVKAFVDSGAQSTIMSERCAERCGLMRLVDRRFEGQAVGIGSAKIVGKVHLAELLIGGVHLHCSFTVLKDDNMEFLLGLDMLRRHQCTIDLKNNLLQLEGPAGPVRVPFLPESEVRGHTDGRFLSPVPNAGAGAGAGTTGAGAGAGAGTTAGASAGTAAAGGGGAVGVAPPAAPPAASAASASASSAAAEGAAAPPALPSTLFDPAALGQLGSAPTAARQAGPTAAARDSDGDAAMGVAQAAGAGAGAATAGTASGAVERLMAMFPFQGRAAIEALLQLSQGDEATTAQILRSMHS